MKYVMTFGCATFAALVLTAFAGVGTASAVQACATGSPDGKCPSAGEREYSGTVVATSTNVIWTNDITNVTCEHSEIDFHLLTSTGSPITIEVTSLTFTKNCKTASGTACTVTVKNLPYHGSLTSSTNATLTDPVGAGAQITCGFLINCEFTTKEMKLAVKSGSPTTMTAANVVLARSGGFCPSTAEWHGTYAVVSPASFTLL